ncbi:BirA family transcriptional regulator, biotin operon repressor / biotin-[acetyl-CoA-carboxylase] ligase [Halanaerobium congolense]|uniref:BirA family transcriptional regulator, biotin operon repressor / biotin-[acetyl-CoA-carboxylase] ligase n=1 Tax=Halanaerobium congolense TaxID=54121 RepID=A0A1G8SX06_9FIRM|nr:biotin--[acetyl-CoA-carboxylase] ligase [Halanaerobium congolense]SDJ33265.1 BirA family transcriptional regulator, biotin operon repressor / biotin-[acetyl-CoA-carboxylase] ligase [Halanaerobium congolense]SET85004.1 BirA family transcriptional regulator, biotin operon repressor / biotin-[acetyl-CoA-carboxylase] ligase [Halanaerobium congolense]
MDILNFFNSDKIKLSLKEPLRNKIKLKLFFRTDSTNDQAKKYLKNMKTKNDINNTYVFAADFQKKGRGRRGHSWFSGGPEGLAASFLFAVEDETAKIPLVTAAAALAVYDTFKYFDLSAAVKWPNDILASQKKIAGILSELVIDNSKNTFVIIGCGINLNNSTFKKEINNLATSYYLERKEHIDKNLFLAVLIEKMNDYVNNYFDQKREEIILMWKEKLALIGKKIDFTYKDNNYTGEIKKILDDGDLLINFNNGQSKKVSSFNTSLNYKSLKKYNK